MCDCGCITTEDTTGYDNTAYQASTYDVTGNPIDYPGYQVPAPGEVEPVPSPALLPAPYDPGMSPNDALINAMAFAPPGSPEAATLASVIASQNAAAGDSLRPTHDIYGNSL